MIKIVSRTCISCNEDYSDYPCIVIDEDGYCDFCAERINNELIDFLSVELGVIKIIEKRIRKRLNSDIPTKGYNTHSRRLIEDAILPILTTLKSTLIIMNKHLKEKYKDETT